MSTQPPNPQLMDRNNVAMAVAQSKSKPPSKANANASKGKMQMHRRSRTGWLLFILVPVGFPPCRALLPLASLPLSYCMIRLPILTPPFPVKVATHADCEGKSATRVRPRARLANILASDASTRDQCGGATTISVASRRTTSR
jgi:hypothetical protein